LLHAVILIKPRDFVLGTVADIRALYCVENWRALTPTIVGGRVIYRQN
jgi:hypothetical protein